MAYPHPRTPPASASSQPLEQTHLRVRPTSASAEIALEMRSLTKVYGNRAAVNGLNLRVRRGEIFGLLGPSGAGKTTTIRMLLHLDKPTAGEVRLFGEPLNSGTARRLLPRVGALIEQPSFQSYLTGRENLFVIGGRTGESISHTRIEETLTLVGLRERAGSRYSTYSSGMRQRLGMAAALLTDPELIILDEPANGLDPAGAVEMRELTRRLGERGKTVFVSSHSLAELRLVCTRIGIVRSGQLIASGSVEELLRATSRWEIRTNEPERVRAVFSGLRGVRSITLERGVALMDAPDARGSEIIAYLAQQGIWPESVRRREEDLEHLFRMMAGD